MGPETVVVVDVVVVLELELVVVVVPVDLVIGLEVVCVPVVVVVGPVVPEQPEHPPALRSVVRVSLCATRLNDRRDQGVRSRLPQCKRQRSTSPR